MTVERAASPEEMELHKEKVREHEALLEIVRERIDNLSENS